MARSRVGRWGLVAVLATGTACSRGAPGPPATGASATTWMAAPGDASVRLEADVRFNSAQIIVANRGGLLWKEVVVRVARAADAPPYEAHVDAILGGRSVEIGALNFEAADHSRLSPFQGAPTVFSLVATLPNGARGHAGGVIGEARLP